MTKSKNLKFALSGLICLAGVTSLSAQIEYDRQAFWSQPHIVEAWKGSYQLDTETTPRIEDEEEQLLVKELLGLLEQGLNDQALQQLLPQIKTESSAALDFLAANLYAEKGDIKSAKRFYAQSVEKYPNFLKAIKNLGIMMVQDGEFTAAIPHLRTAIRLKERDNVTFGLLGLCYVNTDQYISAETAYREAILLDPTVKDWQLGLAKTLLSQQKYQEAIAVLDEILLQEPESDVVWINQANAYLGLDEPETAVANHEIIDRLGKSTAETLELMGNIYMSNNLNELALTYYQKAIAKDPNRPIKTHIDTAEIMVARGAFDEGNAMINRIRSAYANRIAREDEIRLLRLQSQVAFGQGLGAEKFVPILEKLVENDPNDGNALMMLADYYTGLDDIDGYARADLYYQRIVKIPDHEVKGLVSWARSYVARERYGEAIPHLERAQTLDPQPHIQRYLDGVRKINLANLGL